MLLLGLVILIGGIFVNFNESEGNLTVFFGSLLVGIGSAIICFCLVDIKSSATPSAMDVYQGKTTLEITYRDSVPVDSVVVFKKN